MLKSFFSKRSFLFKIRLFFGLFLFIIIIAFLCLKVVPLGKISYSRSYPDHFKLGKGFIYNFSPAERVDLKSGEYPRVSGDPLYFSVFTPRTFDKAEMTITYRDHLSNKEQIVEAGVLTDSIVWRYDLKPIQNKIIDSLKKEWPRLENGSKILLQRDGTYKNWSDLESDLAKGRLKDCPGGINSCLAVYNYNIDARYQAANLNQMPLIINTPLRGAHQLYIYVNNGSLRLKLDFLNIFNDTKDPIQVDLYSASENNKLVDSKKAGEAKTLIFDEKDMANGLYKLDIKVKDDTIIKRIESSVNKLVFINKIWPVSAALPLNLFTDSSYLQAKVYSPASRQTLKFSGENFVLDTPYEQYDLRAKNPAGVQEIRLAKDDVILENNGVFAFSKDSLFNPVPKKINRFFTLNDDVKYILADYEEALDYVSPEFKTKTVTLNLKAAYRENGKYSFMISVPGLKSKSLSGADSTAEDYLEIKEIRLDMKGRNLGQKIFNKSF